MKFAWSHTKDDSWNYILYMGQSRVDVEYYSVAYFNHVTALQVLKRRTSTKGGARTCCVNMHGIHEQRSTVSDLL